MIIATQKCAVLVVVGMNKTCTFGAELMVDDLAFFQDVIPEKYRDDKTVYLMQPSGKFLIGGPRVSCMGFDSANNINHLFLTG